MILWLTGPSGGGKSTVGPLVAAQQKHRFVDLDALIERRTGLSIAEIFDREGESKFRELETEAIKQVIAKKEAKDDLVIATGGGSVVNPYNRDLMRSSGLRVYFNVEATTAIARLSATSGRPLLLESNPERAWKELLEERITVYADHDIMIDAGQSPAEVTDAILAAHHRYNSPSWKINAELRGETSRICAYRSPWSTLRAYRGATRMNRTCVITDTNLAEHYPEFLKRLAGTQGLVCALEPGEKSKSFATVEKIVQQLSEGGFDRNSTILGFGGGVITDLAGFVASIYMRGIHLFSMPTSLLAMVDASVGGKTAINSSTIRNLVGTFNHPERVLICPSFLRTLPDRELRSGLVESLKMGIIRSEVLQELVDESLPDILNGRIPKVIDEIIRLSVVNKLDIIGNDVQDTGERGLLNFGHTFAHALEAAAPGVWTHGEAVAFGMIAALEAAGRTRVSPLPTSEIHVKASKILPLTNPNGTRPSPENIVEKMQRDKKQKIGIAHFVLPTGPLIKNTGWSIGILLAQEIIAYSIEAAWRHIDDYHGMKST